MKQFVLLSIIMLISDLVFPCKLLDHNVSLPVWICLDTILSNRSIIMNQMSFCLDTLHHSKSVYFHRFLHGSKELLYLLHSSIGICRYN